MGQYGRNVKVLVGEVDKQAMETGIIIEKMVLGKMRRAIKVGARGLYKMQWEKGGHWRDSEVA